MLSRMFELRGELLQKEKIMIEIVGAIFMILIWSAICKLNLVSPYILPPPWKVVSAFVELYEKDNLVGNILFSLQLNLIGCLEAVIISVPIGFLIGLNPVIKAFSERYLGASRFLPLPATLGLFIAWFGIYVNMKVQFLAVSIIVYLIPVVVQRVAETPQVYIDTVKTLGASKWQTIRYVFMPDVFSRVWVDIGVLGAISWTYITIAERINDNEGGIGALAGIASRQSRTDKVYAVLITIILIALVFDRVHGICDRMMFKFKENK